ncbi:GEVED domain-containing protein [Spirosoma linguale]|uniref:Conserved repeat domain protein n=1 Tax=Spirosoma linguale (strain ATCC 33905 / DSM 74 / LMG 10896 / Claus 1) TaxID=504472 RepID=D2QD33_SPILD|nr:conserved repeat domain protein [Spirosoma linguale DSM 74]
MRYFVLLLISVALFPVEMLAQRPDHPTHPLPLCATTDLTEAERNELNLQAAQALAAKRASNAVFTTITYVPIRPHILRKSDGTGGMSLASINQVIAITNSYYLKNGFGIQFYFCGTSPDYINNDTEYNSFSNETALTQGHDVTNAMNQYYVNSFASGAGGYAYYPGNSLVTTRSFILNESWNEDDMGNRLIPHELGHNFNLVHTFGQVPGNGTLGSGTTLELVTRGTGANCTTEGDYICDTPADPYNKAGANLLYVNGCPQYDPASTARDANGIAYTPSISNIMSYYFPCSHDFTPGQYDRIQAGLALRQTHTAYTLDCPPTAVPTPTNLVLSTTGSAVLLTWQDNASNEMGYFIERSQSPTSDFLPIGGVGPNTSTFTDSKTTPSTVYYYRIRPSNATTSGVSQIVSIRSPSCRPVYAYSCTYGDGLASFSINNNFLSQNSGCSTNGYGLFNVTSTTLVAGQTYPVSGTLLTANLTQGVAIWADLNRNGAFETSKGELLYQTPSLVLASFSGKLALPASLTAGTLTLRVTVVYNVLPGDPCGNYTYGETEDYVISTTRSTDLSLSLQTSNRTLSVNQPVSYSLTLQNAGPSDATGISWQNALPANMSFVSGDASIVSSGTAVGVSNLSLVSGTSASFVYRLKTGQEGTFINAAQITASNEPDPDSKPGSGTGDGQDDAATVDIRTRVASTVYTSPNPNQTPLPPVLSGQPTPDPAKADLSLAMRVNQRTPALGQNVTFTITVSNAGGLTATNIVVRDTVRGLTLAPLPAGMAVVSTTGSYTIIQGTIASLAKEASAQLTFTGTPTLAGHLTNAAQIWSVDTPDPDSKPGASTPTANNLNGEDDVAWVDLKVR